MIVDDEEPVLESFAFILSKDVEDFVLCGKARSGLEAISLVPQVLPDLIFMDIQMPGIDGLETITRIREQYPHIVFILATAYERFDIAKKAIPLGVFSYLVKPVSRKMLVSELEKAKSHLDKVRFDANTIMHDVQFLTKTKQEEKNRFLSSLLWKNPSEQEWQYFSNLFSVKSDTGIIYIARIIDDLADELKNSIYLKFTEQIQFKHICFSLKMAGQVIIFFPEDKDIRCLDANIQGIQDRFSDYNLIVAKGELCQYSSLTRSYLKAENALNEMIRKDSSDSGNEADMVKKICRMIILSDWSEMQSVFEEYWSDIFGRYNFQVAKGKMVALFTLVINEIGNRSASVRALKIDPAEEIMVLNSMEEWRNWSEMVIERLRLFIETNETLSYPRPLEIALDYISKNFSKPIHLSGVAEKCRVSSGYLSRLFSDHLNISFIEYLNRYKLAIAMNYLKEENMSVKEVSFLVGYQDPNYFSRIFKKYMHISPSGLYHRRTTG